MSKLSYKTRSGLTFDISKFLSKAHGKKCCENPTCDHVMHVPYVHCYNCGSSCEVCWMIVELKKIKEMVGFCPICEREKREVET